MKFSIIQDGTPLRRGCKVQGYILVCTTLGVEVNHAASEYENEYEEVPKY